ncbi:S9 family peptidase [Brevibacterium samyangense]|uniref:S9 family peptidase n=1 Tax=Brevibacterium samyangense TaxID=366888 RepID=A0ABP5F0T0_9MICO
MSDSVPTPPDPSASADGAAAPTDGAAAPTVPPAPPVPEQRPHERTHHGDTFVDPYEWLRDKEDPEVLAHLTAENDYTLARTAHLEGLRETIFGEIKSRVKETDMSVPVRRGDWWYFSRTLEGKDYAVHCRVPVTDPADWTPPVVEDGQTLPGEVVVFDSNVEAEGKEFFSLGSFSYSPDGTRLAWGEDVAGDERYLLRIRDLATGEDLSDEIPNTFAGAFFDVSGQYVYYCTVDDAWRPDRVWRHRVGTSANEDVEIFHEPDERYWVGMGLTRSQKYLLIGIGSKISSSYWYIDTSEPEGTPVNIWPLVEGVEYSVTHAVVPKSDGVEEDRFVITHNRDRADFDVVDVPVIAPRDEKQWRPVLHGPAGEDVTAGKRIEDVSTFRDFFAVSYREGGFARVGVVPVRGGAGSGAATGGGTPGGPAEAPRASGGEGASGAERAPVAEGASGAEGASASPYGAFIEVTAEEPIGTMGVMGNPEWVQPRIRMAYGSYTTPTTVFEYEVATGERTVLKQQPVLGGVDLGAYTQDLQWAEASDGTKIPVSLVWRPDAVAADGPRETLLYGYGSYEASMDPYFSVARLSLLDRGVVWAVAHVRGGGEMGRHWYDNGKTLTKKNTFTDFVAVADHLIDSGQTEPAKMVAMGGSAGGLLMGAVANIAPDRFAGISAHVPFVDTLTSILMPELPLTVIEWDEWGDPLHDPEVYAYIKSYSPYENVRAGLGGFGPGGYPKILAITSLNDTRVLYVEPAKWVARLRDVGADAMMKIEMVAGHGGKSGRYEAWKETAFEWAWILDTLGIAE